MLKSKVNRLTSSMIAGLVLALPAANVTADTFSAGGGWPFILAPTITLKQGNNIEYYANYKLGLDDGFTAGVQWPQGIMCGAVLLVLWVHVKPIYPAVQIPPIALLLILSSPTEKLPRD